MNVRLRRTICLSRGRQFLNDITVCSSDQCSERLDVIGDTGTKFDVSHVLARTLQQASRIRECRTLKESNVDVLGEDVDVGEAGVFDAPCGTTIMHEFTDLAAAAPNFGKPLGCKCGEVGRP